MNNKQRNILIAVFAVFVAVGIGSFIASRMELRKETEAHDRAVAAQIANETRIKQLRAYTDSLATRRYQLYRYLKEFPTEDQVIKVLGPPTIETVRSSKHFEPKGGQPCALIDYPDSLKFMKYDVTDEDFYASFAFEQPTSKLLTVEILGSEYEGTFTATQLADPSFKPQKRRTDECFGNDMWVHMDTRGTIFRSKGLTGDPDRPTR